MNKISLLVLLSPALAFANANYVVRKGDTILRISDRTLGIQNDTKDQRRYDFAKQIIAKNPELKDPNVLTPGQTLAMPEHERQPSAAAPAKPVPEKAEPTLTLLPAPAKTEAASETKAEPTKTEPVKVEPATPAPAVATPEAKPAEPAAKAEPVKIETVKAESAKAEPAKEPAHAEETEADFLVVQPRWSHVHYRIKNEDAEQKFSLDAQNVGFGLGYGVALGADAHLLLQAGFDSVRLSNPKSDDELSIDGKTQTLKNFALGVEWHATHDLRVELLAMYNDRLFALPTEDSSRYGMKVVAVPAAELALKYSVAHFASSALGVGVAGEYLRTVKKDDLKYKSALDPVGSIYWETERGAKSTNFGVTAYYAPNAQHPEGLEQEAEAVGINLNLIFGL